MSEQISRNWLKLQESLIREIGTTPSQLQSANKISTLGFFELCRLT